MKFKTTKSPHKIGVEDQDLVVKFCFAKQTQPELHENMTYWSECRDFMGDAVCAMHDGKEKSIYGFKYNPVTHPLEFNQCIIGIRFPNAETRKTFDSQLSRIEEFATQYKLPFKYYINKFKGSPNTRVIHMTPFWQKTTFNISLMTFLLKAICWKLNPDMELLTAIENTTCNGVPTKEARYLQKDVKQRLVKLLPHLVELTAEHKYPHGYDFDKDVGTIHNRSGFNFNCRWPGMNTVISDWIKLNETL